MAVVRRPLTTVLVSRGTVISPAAAAVVAPPMPPGDTAEVVTTLPTSAGAEVQPGQAVAAFDGRPLLVLPSRLAMYRDLKPGDTGPDVSAIQAALWVAGHPIPSSEAGRFGPDTQSAVARRRRRSSSIPHPVVEGPGGGRARRREPGGHGRHLPLGKALAAQPTDAASAAADDQAVQAARTAYASAQQERQTRQATEGLVLPAREVMVDSSLPATLEGVTATLGEPVAPGTPIARWARRCCRCRSR